MPASCKSPAGTRAMQLLVLTCSTSFASLQHNSKLFVTSHSLGCLQGPYMSKLCQCWYRAALLSRLRSTRGRVLCYSLSFVPTMPHDEAMMPWTWLSNATIALQVDTQPNLLCKPNFSSMPRQASKPNLLSMPNLSTKLFAASKPNIRQVIFAHVHALLLQTV